MHCLPVHNLLVILNAWEAASLTAVSGVGHRVPIVVTPPAPHAGGHAADRDPLTRSLFSLV